MREPHSFQYRPEIDGLRTLAVIPVLLFHAGFGVPGGFAGVDVFFVISGYLIGSGILREAETGRFGYLSFWQRRLRRLFPAWAVVMIATILLSAFTLVPPHLRDLGECLLYQPVFAANVYFWRQTGYFETASEFQPLLHTWSLAVEEQFYLFLPLVLIPLIRFGKKITLKVIVALSVVSIFVSGYFAVRYPSFGFLMLPARIWELNMGVILALLPLAMLRLERFAGVGAWIGIGCLGLSYFGFDGDTPFPSYTSLLPCAGAAMVVLTSTWGCGSAGKLLAHPLSIWIGKISYPLYLWHWPVIVFVRYLWIDEPPPAVMAGCLLRTPEMSADEPEKGVALFRDHFSRLIRDLESRGSRVWVMRTVGLQPQSVPETLARIASRGKDPNSIALPLSEHQQRAAPMNELLDQTTAGTGAILLDPLPYFADAEGRHLMASEGRSLYKDSDHLSPAGAIRLRGLFEPLFQAAVKAK